MINKNIFLSFKLILEIIKLHTLFLENCFSRTTICIHFSNKFVFKPYTKIVFVLNVKILFLQARINIDDK